MLLHCSTIFGPGEKDLGYVKSWENGMYTEL